MARARRLAMVAAVQLTALLLPAGHAAAATPPCCAPVPPGLVSWWNGNDTAADFLGLNDGALQGGAGYAPAEVGDGFTFDSTDDAVFVPDATDLYPGTGSFTADAWIRTTGPQATNGGVIVRHYECANFCSPVDSNGLWDLAVTTGGNLAAFVRDNTGAGPDGGGQVLTGTAGVGDGAFHHVALVRDVTAGKLRLYVDGVKDAEADLEAGSSGEISNIDGDADELTIGGGILGGTSSLDPQVEFTGVIDELQWFLSALTDQQIAAIAAAGPAGMCTDEIAPVSSASAPATSSGGPIRVDYTASDTGGSGLARVYLWVRTPKQAAASEVAVVEGAATSGSFQYTPADGDGAYEFFTKAEDASCGREAAPAQPDAVTTVSTPVTAPVTTPVTTTPAAPAAPAPKPVAITAIATLPSAHACVSRRRFRIRLRNVAGLVRAVIQLNGRAARTVKGRALGLPIDLRGLPKGRVVVRIVVTRHSGQRLVGTRTYHTCVPRSRR